MLQVTLRLHFHHSVDSPNLQNLIIASTEERGKYLFSELIECISNLLKPHCMIYSGKNYIQDPVNKFKTSEIGCQKLKWFAC